MFNLIYLELVFDTCVQYLLIIFGSQQIIMFVLLYAYVHLFIWMSHFKITNNCF